MTGELRFHRWVDPAERGADRKQAVEANEGERANLAAWLDIPAVHSFHADLLVTRTGTESAEVTGDFQAEVELICGVSLDPFPQRISGTVKQEFRKPHATAHRDAVAQSGDVEIDLEQDEPGEWRPQGIDLGAMLAEELSLALPDFPRKPGAELEDLPDAGKAEDKPNPFAALARLKGEDS